MSAPGRWIVVCGPSGAGKDTLLAWARARLAGEAGIVFAPRLITRPPHPGSDHLPTTEAQFDRLLAAGELALHWQAHGLRYGVARVWAEQLAVGCAVVVNGSRAHVQTLRAQGVAHCAVQVVAPDDVLRQRLAARGREDPTAIHDRLERNRRLAQTTACGRVVNDGDVAQAGGALAELIRACAGQTARAPAG
jgi:ribose 1,5-bisphosphokinase